MTTGTDTANHSDECDRTIGSCQWCRGYEEQSAWLQGKTLADAEYALRSRLATLGDGDPYNEGGNVATRDYIAHLREEG